jgi:hypothetical protein
MMDRRNNVDGGAMEINRSYPCPLEDVFEGAMRVLEEMGLDIRSADISQGRIVADRGPYTGAKGGYLDLRLIGMTEVTFVHVSTRAVTLKDAEAIIAVRTEFFTRLGALLEAGGTS